MHRKRRRECERSCDLVPFLPCASHLKKGLHCQKQFTSGRCFLQFVTSVCPCSGCDCIKFPSSISISFLNVIWIKPLKVVLHNGAHHRELNEAIHKGDINRVMSKSILKEHKRRLDFGETAELLKLLRSDKPNLLWSNSVTSR